MNKMDPYFLFDYDVIDYNVNKLELALSIFDDFKIYYSTKTNCLNEIIKYLYKKNINMECVSIEEYDYLLNLGVDKKRIMFNGPNKNRNIIKYIINNGSICNIDSLYEAYELVSIKKELKINENLGIRINCNFDEDLMNSLISKNNSRFGVDLEEFDKIMKLFLDNNVRVNGLHMHINSNYYIDYVYKNYAKNIVKLIKKYKLNLKFIDLGGGILRAVEKVDYRSILEKFALFLKQNGILTNDIKFIVEPGAAIVANSAKLVAKVINKKNVNSETYLTLNITKNYFDVTNKFSNWSHISYESNCKKTVKKQYLYGFTCMENDIITTLCNKKELFVGDTVIIDKVGAYSITFSPLFICGHPEIRFQRNNKILKKIKKISIDNFWRRSNEFN